MIACIAFTAGSLVYKGEVMRHVPSHTHSAQQMVATDPVLSGERHDCLLRKCEDHLENASDACRGTTWMRCLKFDNAVRHKCLGCIECAALSFRAGSIYVSVSSYRCADYVEIDVTLAASIL